MEFINCDSRRSGLMIQETLQISDSQSVKVKCKTFFHKLTPLEGVLPDEIKNFMDLQSPCMDIKSGDIHNTSKVVEGEFLDLLAQVESKQQWATGPILPTKFDCISTRNEICLEWLNKQPP
ncbi:hypothetical protein H5410_016543 [Solanum commersonii]|uniref:Glycosyltransferase N-terminal domain-containing protein n=1 Tax=Solanum commersonii TaxID=4109 RepID=A0A9J5ZXZ0_SOLCO|nr:hypothetical protein H5410_016543 [Solanum commersonii]